MERLKAEVRDNPMQVERIERIQALAGTVERGLRGRADPAQTQGSGARLAPPPGRELKDAIREEFDQFFLVERRARRAHGRGQPQCRRRPGPPS